MTWHQQRGIIPPRGFTVMLLDTPDRRQAGEYDCGRAAASTVLTYHNIPEADAVGLLGRLMVDKEDGTDPAMLATWFRQIGWEVTEGTTDVATLRHHTEAYRPVIVLAELDGVGHWQVCRGVSRGYVYLQCPKEGRVKVKADDFVDKWNDHNRYGARFRRWGVVAVPPG